MNLTENEPMTDLADFLLARIAEDEEWARLSAGPDYSDGEPGTPGHSARVLAECEAKRRIVEALAARGPDAGLTSEADKGATWALRQACKLLSLPYADHPDYRQEWRP